MEGLYISPGHWFFKNLCSFGQKLFSKDLFSLSPFFFFESEVCKQMQVETLVKELVRDTDPFSLTHHFCEFQRGLQGSLGFSQDSTGIHYSRESETSPWIN